MIKEKTYKGLLQRVISHFRPQTRWPCPDCGRTSTNMPLRSITSVTEDGAEYMHGCHLCNADDLLDEIVQTLDLV